jgi:hypothetical protein
MLSEILCKVAFAYQPVLASSLTGIRKESFKKVTREIQQNSLS